MNTHPHTNTSSLDFQYQPQYALSWQPPVSRQIPGAGPKRPEPAQTRPTKGRRPEQFHEYLELCQQFTILDQLNLQNPFFKVNEAVVSETTIIEGREYISYSGFNYLSLAGEARVAHAVKKAVDQYGTSVSASRIATGERPLNIDLEQKLTETLGTEDCLAYVSGYGTNVTVIEHLLGPNDLVLYDALCHNSILKGCRLSGAQRISFAHNDPAFLAKILKEIRHQYDRVLIVIEGVYSMDGDIADLPAFIELRQAYDTLLMVDEAHSIGTLGATGRGIGEHFGVDPSEVDIWMGTLSKSLASCGGYIAGSKALVTLLKYTCPGFLFSCGITPANAAAALAALCMLREIPERVGQLQENARFFLDLARQKGLNTGLSQGSPIVPIIIGNSVNCLKLADALFKKGINVQPILYPAVPEATSRLRFFITANHTEKQMLYTLETLSSCIAG